MALTEEEQRKIEMHKKADEIRARLARLRAKKKDSGGTGSEYTISESSKSMRGNYSSPDATVMIIRGSEDVSLEEIATGQSSTNKEVERKIIEVYEKARKELIALIEEVSSQKGEWSDEVEKKFIASYFKALPILTREEVNERVRAVLIDLQPKVERCAKNLDLQDKYRDSKESIFTYIDARLQRAKADKEKFIEEGNESKILTNDQLLTWLEGERVIWDALAHGVSTAEEKTNKGEDIA